MKHYTIPVFISHLGCPHRCVFCDQSRITAVSGEKVSLIRGEDVLRIAREHLATLPDRRDDRIVELAFFGGTFTGIPTALQEELLEAAGSLKEAGSIQRIRCSTRPDSIDEMVLERCIRYGMDTIELGVQSLDDRVLALSGRGHNAQTVRRASRLIHEFGLRLGHQIMPGLPGADPGSDLATAEASIAMKPAEVRIYPTLVLEGTPLAELWRKGLFVPMELEDAVTLTGKVMSLYEEAGVIILRAGLQATEEISADGSLLAGPWHPAFRELVLSDRLAGRIAHAAQERNEELEVTIHPRDLSSLYAGGKRYYKVISEHITSVKQDTRQERGKVLLKTRTGDPYRILCI